MIQIEPTGQKGTFVIRTRVVHELEALQKFSGEPLQLLGVGSSLLIVRSGELDMKMEARGAELHRQDGRD